MSDFLTRRRLLLKQALASGLFISASSLLAPIVHAFGQIPKKLPPGKSIYELKGQVTIDGSTATIDTVITASSIIKTGSNSLIIFAVGKDAHILRENSEMTLSGNGMVEEGLRLLTGKLLSVFGKRQADEKLSLATTTATIGIRGTGVYAESKPDSSYLCTCYGSANISSTTDPTQSEQVTTTHHDAPRFILLNPEGGKLIVPAPVFNHTDEELMLVEAIVGRNTPFSSVKSYSKPRKGY